MQAAFAKWIDDTAAIKVDPASGSQRRAGPRRRRTRRRDSASEPQLTEQKRPGPRLALAYDAIAKPLMISGWIVTNGIMRNKNHRMLRGDEANPWLTLTGHDAGVVLSETGKIPA